MKKLSALLAVILIAVPCLAYGWMLAGVMSSYAPIFPPNAATSLTATPGAGQNTVTWTASAVDGSHSPATSYNLLWGTNAGDEPNTITGVTSPYVHSPLSGGTTYFYKVSAVNPGGSATSAEAGPFTPVVIFDDQFTGANGSAFNSSTWQTYLQTDGTLAAGTTKDIQSNALKFHQAFATGTYGGTHFVSQNAVTYSGIASVETTVTGMPTKTTISPFGDQANLINLFGQTSTISGTGAPDKNYLSLRLAGDGANLKFFISSLNNAGSPSTSTMYTVTADSSPHTYKLVLISSTQVDAYMDGVKIISAFTHNVTWGSQIRVGFSYYVIGGGANNYKDYSVDYFVVQ